MQVGRERQFLGLVHLTAERGEDFKVECEGRALCWSSVVALLFWVWDGEEDGGDGDSRDEGITEILLDKERDCWRRDCPNSA